MGDEHLKELMSIRKLLVLGLLNQGMTQKQVAAALGLDRSQISSMFLRERCHRLAKELANERRAA